MKKVLSLLFSLVLVCLLAVPAFAYSTSVAYNAETTPPHTVTFDPNGGRVTTSQITLEANGYITNLPTPTRSGYTFQGWYTDKTFTTKFTETTLVDKNVTLVAQWKIKSGGWPGGWPSISPGTSTGSGTVESPKTFDSGIAAYSAMALLSAASGAALVVTKKKATE